MRRNEFPFPLHTLEYCVRVINAYGIPTQQCVNYVLKQFVFRKSFLYRQNCSSPPRCTLRALKSTCSRTAATDRGAVICRRARVLCGHYIIWYLPKKKHVYNILWGVRWYRDNVFVYDQILYSSPCALTRPPRPAHDDYIEELARAICPRRYRPMIFHLLFSSLACNSADVKYA